MESQEHRTHLLRTNQLLEMIVQQNNELLDLLSNAEEDLDEEQDAEPRQKRVSPTDN